MYCNNESATANTLIVDIELSANVFFSFPDVCLVSDVCMFLDLSQCWSEAAAVSLPGLAQEIPYTDPR